MVDFLVTHSGRFHADDVCATAILKELFPAAEILRTRDDVVMEKLRGKHAVIYDVGRMYDPEKLSFDHHMRDAATREDGTIYSSFGLIWKEYGRQFLSLKGYDKEDIEWIFDTFDERFVLPVDKIDNGHLSPSDIGETRFLSLSEMIDAFNPAFDDENPEAANDGFNAAVLMASSTISAQIGSIAAEIRAEKIVREKISEQWGNPVLELPISADVQSVIDDLEARHILFIIQPSSSGGFGLTCARESAGTYNNLVDLPESWGGLTGQDLVEETGVEGVTFCHAGLFFAAGETRECLRQLAAQAMPESPSPQM